jgi:hypothetical protein
MVGVRGSVVGWGTTLQAGRSRDRIPDEVDFFNLPNPSSRTMALGSTQPLTEMSTRNIPGGEELPARKADNLIAICEPIVYKMWDPQHLKILWVSTVRYRDTFTFYLPKDGRIIKLSHGPQSGKKIYFHAIKSPLQMHKIIIRFQLRGSPWEAQLLLCFASSDGNVTDAPLNDVAFFIFRVPV